MDRNGDGPLPPGTLGTMYRFPTEGEKRNKKQSIPPPVIGVKTVSIVRQPVFGTEYGVRTTLCSWLRASE